MAIFLAPVIGLTNIMQRYEFAKSSGAIHFHRLGFTQSETDQRLDEALSQWGLTVDGAVKNFDEYIATVLEAHREEAVEAGTLAEEIVSPLGGVLEKRSRDHGGMEGL